MRIAIHTYSFGEVVPKYTGYIEMDQFDADKCWELCNWTAWTKEKPKNLHSDIGSCSHGICFTNPETKEKWMALSLGWLVGDEKKISSYAERHKNDIIWKKEYVLVSQGIEIYRTTDKEEADKMMNESNEQWHRYCQKCIENGDRPADNEVFMYEEGKD